MSLRRVRIQTRSVRVADVARAVSDVVGHELARIDSDTLGEYFALNDDANRFYLSVDEFPDYEARLEDIDSDVERVDVNIVGRWDDSRWQWLQEIAHAVDGLIVTEIETGGDAGQD